MPKSPKYIRAVEDDVWTDMRMMSVSKKLTMGEYVEFLHLKYKTELQKEILQHSTIRTN